MNGRLIGIIGPSGSGKDSLIQALVATEPAYSAVRRVVTRTVPSTGEAIDAVTEDEFDRRKNSGAFCLDWSAHGLRYGIPYTTRVRVNAGESLLVNLSRTVLTDALHIFPSLCVLSVSVRPDILSARLAKRGRESSCEVSARLNRRSPPPPTHLPVIAIDNNGSLDQAVSVALTHLQPMSAQ